VLAAVGTALPETMIPIIAILFSGNADTSHAVGVGAILGAPFMLSTLAMFVTGVAVILVARRHRPNDDMPVNPTVLWHDIKFFALAYAIAVGIAFLPREMTLPRIGAAVVLVLIYAFYVREHFQADEGHNPDSELAPLRFHRFDRRAPAHPAPPRLRIVSIQVLFALGCIVVGATVFVQAVEHLAHSFGVDEVLLALVIAPIATELPEKFNSVIWVRQGKDTLAMGNITGAMVFQSTIPTVVALVFAADHWAIGPGTTVAFASAGIAFLSSAAIFIPMARRGRLTGRALLVGGPFYVAYLALVIAAGSGAIPL
jgi:cation:H+ antiporter